MQEPPQAGSGGADLTPHQAALLTVIRAGPSPESNGALQLVENTVKSLATYGRDPDRVRVDFVLAALGCATGHPSVAVRKPAYYRLQELARRLSDLPIFDEWMGRPEVFAACRRGLADSRDGSE